ncbi:MAG: U32 family peptidase [Clostridiales bacterium]|nr:U32 family peptidase [Clostridiales bacterium]
MIRTKKVELLAPAGSLEICKAVINAGADAVYLGGQMFGARAFAGNLNTEEVIQAIEYAHLRGAKIYMTVNTLLKESEIEEVYGYLRPFYEAGLDAVIVQDLGVLKLISECFPMIDIHASTQMNVMSHEFANKLKEYGVTRIVIPREFKLDEIERFSKECGLEIEAFVHGAQCYSYSGQCLFSAMNGARSGNRGKCAQSCRLEYTAVEESNLQGREYLKGRDKKICDACFKGHTRSEYPKFGETARFLSTRDMNTLSILPEIIDAGVYSLKIEGRMKNISYAAGIVSIYRKYIDKYLSGENTDVDPEDFSKMLDLYNRGDFSTGFFKEKKGPWLLSMQRANHKGTLALEVVSNKKGFITFKALEDINAGDVFEINRENSFTSGEDVKIGCYLSVNLPSRYDLTKGSRLYRMNNAKLQRDIREKYIEKEKKTPVNIDITVRTGQPLRLCMTQPDESISAEVTGSRAEPAQNRALTREELKKRLEKLGNTVFYPSCTNIKMDENIFVPVGALNELRREGVERLMAAMLEKSSRQAHKLDNRPINDIIACNSPEERSYSALVYDKKQAEIVFKCDHIKRVYISHHLVRKPEWSEEMLRRGKAENKEMFIALPMFVREKHFGIFQDLLENCVCPGWDGLLIRSMEELAIISRLEEEGVYRGPKRIVTDYNIYSYNTKAAAFLTEIFKDTGLSTELITMPMELNADDLSRVDRCFNTELVVYGRPVVMTSEHCVKKTFADCDVNFGEAGLSGAENKLYRVLCFCDYCNNVIFNAEPLNLLGRPEIGKELRPAMLRFDFTVETPEETRKALELINMRSGENNSKKFTGRFLVSVD